MERLHAFIKEHRVDDAGALGDEADYGGTPAVFAVCPASGQDDAVDCAAVAVAAEFGAGGHAQDLLSLVLADVELDVLERLAQHLTVVQAKVHFAEALCWDQRTDGPWQRAPHTVKWVV